MTRTRLPARTVGLLVAGAVLLGAVLILAEAGIAREDGGRISPGLAAVLAALAVAPALLVGRWPGPAVLGVGVLLGAGFASGLPDGPIHILTPIVVLAAAVSLTPRELGPWLGGAVVALLAGQLGTLTWQDKDWPSIAWNAVGTLALCLAAATAGWWLRSRREARQERERRAATEEQLRMARDLHDGVGHGLAVIAMQAGVGLHVLERDPAGARRALEAIREASTDALDALRGELQLLTGEHGARRPDHGLAELPALVDRVRTGGLRVDLHLREPRPLPPGVDAAGYAIVQEALTNVLRHAAAEEVRVEVRAGAIGTTVLVADDGRGGEVTGSGLGLRGMRSRVEALGGTLTAGPHPRRGFEVAAMLPWEEP